MNNKINSPICLAKKSIDDIFENNKKSLMSLTFISTFSFKIKLDEYLLPKQNKFFIQKWNKTFMVTVYNNSIKITLKANFILRNAKECTLVYNDKSGRKPLKYYLLTFENSNGKIERDVEVANNSKSDYKQFQADLNSHYNNFAVNMSESEFKTFVAECVYTQITSDVTFYTNAGVIEENKFLYKNALVVKDGIIWADKDGYIKIDDKKYIKLAESTHYLPQLAKSTKTGKEIAYELLTNIVECWGENIVLPLITLGHMIMSVFFEVFVQKYGVPTLILFGETGTGKSTLVTVGLAIFGMSRDALSSGGSTAKSNEYFSSKYNGMNICIDDVKGEILNSPNFTTLVKGAYKAIPRTRMLPYAKGVEYIHICSPLACSTNDPLPNLQEVVNRLNIVEIFGKVFKADKFKYHEVSNNSENLKELSVILPEVLKFDITKVQNLYDKVFSELENSVKDTQKRIIHNIAYAYTGVLLLSYISGFNFTDIHQKVIEFANKQIMQYNGIKTLVDKVLTAIVTLADLKYLVSGTHFRFFVVENQGKSETHIRFKKDVVLTAINKFYSNDKSMRIDSNNFLRHATHNIRFRGNNKGVRYDDDRNTVVSSICFDVSDLEDFRPYFPRGNNM